MAFATPTTQTSSSGQVKISATDTTADYLFSKLVAGTGVTLTQNNAGGNETITIASSSSGGSWRTITQPDGVTVAFTIPAGATTNTVILELNGQVQTPTTDYSISGTTLTYTSAPVGIHKIFF